MMSLTFGLFTQVSGSGPLGPLVLDKCKELNKQCLSVTFLIDFNKTVFFCKNGPAPIKGKN